MVAIAVEFPSVYILTIPLRFWCESSALLWAELLQLLVKSIHVFKEPAISMAGKPKDVSINLLVTSQNRELVILGDSELE